MSSLGSSSSGCVCVCVYVSHQVAQSAANSRTGLRGQEDHSGGADGPDLPADAQDHVHHHGSEEVGPRLLSWTTSQHSGHWV